MSRNLYSINTLLVEQFSSSLKKEGFSKITIKNYITDINQFLLWRDKENVFNQEELLSNYILEISDRFSKASVKRKISAIKKYLVFENIYLSSKSTETDKKLSKITLVPFLVGFFLILTIPVINYYMYSQVSNLQREMDTIRIPQSTTISTADGKSYNFANSQGIKVFLTNEKLEDKSQNIESPLLPEAFESKEIEDITFQGTTTIYKGNTKAIISSDLISESSFIYVTPRSSTNNQTLYIEEQAKGYAIISVDSPASNNIILEWKVDNTEVYHSIL